jgi:hypothetical protein
MGWRICAIELAPYWDSELTRQRVQPLIESAHVLRRENQERKRRAGKEEPRVTDSEAVVVTVVEGRLRPVQVVKSR